MPEEYDPLPPQVPLDAGFDPVAWYEVTHGHPPKHSHRHSITPFFAGIAVGSVMGMILMAYLLALSGS